MDVNEQQEQQQDVEPELPPAARESLEAAPPAEEAAQDAPPEVPAVDPVVATEEQPAEDPAAEALAALAAFEGRAAPAPEPQQPAGMDPRVFAQAVREAVEASPQARLVSEVLARQAAVAQAPRPPQEPGPDATVADWQRYSAQAADFAVRSAVAPLQQQMNHLHQTFGTQLQQIQQTFQQQAEHTRQQQYRQTLDNALAAVAQKPSYAWLQEDPLRAEMVKMAYERARGAPGITLEKVVEHIGRSFGMLPPAPQQVAQQNRAAATTALAAKRAAAKAAPVRPAAGGKAPPARQTQEEKLRKAGLWDALPDDMKELNRMRDRRAMN